MRSVAVPSNKCFGAIVFVLLFDVLLTHSRSVCPVDSPCFCEKDQQDRYLKYVTCGHSKTGIFPRIPRFKDKIIQLSIIYSGLTYIPYGAFYGLQLDNIDLQGNNFQRGISPKAFVGVTKYLRSLNLAWANISSLHSKVFRGMLYLQNLTLAENDLHHLPGPIFQDLRRLQNLVVAGNPLYTLPDEIFRFQANLEYLDLGYCKLTKLPWHLLLGLWNLRQLDLRGNMIHNLEPYTFMGMYSLQTLLLDHNPIRRLTSKVFMGLRNVRKLRIEESKLEFIGQDVFQATKNLQSLELGDNKITHLRYRTLLIPTLQKLSLDGNSIHSIPPEVRYLKQLKHLDISYNSITRIDFCLFDVLRNLEFLNLRENPFACDCSMFWLRKLERALMYGWDRKRMLPFVPGRCAEPEHLRGIGITSWLDLGCIKQFYMYGHGTKCKWS
jgi:hypothetical protein